jgi:hypothetical protein
MTMYINYIIYVNFTMDQFIDNLTDDELKRLYTGLLDYILGDLKFVMQMNIASELGPNFSASQIARHKTITKWEISNKDFLRRFLGRMGIKFAAAHNSFKFEGGNVYSKAEKQPIAKDSLFFGTPDGCKWIVYSHLTSSREPVVDEIEKRILFIEPNNSARYIIKSKTHSDYSGKWRYSTEGGYLILDLQTGLKKKDLHIRFSVIGEDSTPDIMLGILVQSLAKENSIACHKIIAVNCSAHETDEMPVSIPFEEFKKSDPQFAAYFELSNNMLSSPHGIITVNHLIRFTKKINSN